MSVFTDIMRQGLDSRVVPARTQQSRDWYRTMASTSTTTPTAIMREERRVNSVQMGQMYFFMYDPKLKEKLPYYDTFPLIFPFNTTDNGFLGINMHYLPLIYRAKLMDSLYNLASDKRYDFNTKLNISYKILSGAAGSIYYKPCVKQYLNGHVRSRFIEIPANQWDIALFLPVEQFQKKTTSQVHQDINKQLARNLWR